MFKNFFDEKTKKKMASLLMLLGVCVIALIGISVMEEEEIQNEINNAGLVSEEVTQNEIESIENDLKEILSQINGAGELDVMITFNSSEEIQPAYNTNTTTEETTETDSEGGERTITTSSENRTIITSTDSDPIVLKTNEAVIKGVIVVAEGAHVPEVKTTLYSAVQTALQIEGHQVEIYDK